MDHLLKELNVNLIMNQSVFYLICVVYPMSIHVII